MKPGSRSAEFRTGNVRHRKPTFGSVREVALVALRQATPRGAAPAVVWRARLRNLSGPAWAGFVAARRTPPQNDERHCLSHSFPTDCSLTGKSALQADDYVFPTP